MKTISQIANSFHEPHHHFLTLSRRSLTRAKVITERITKSPGIQSGKACIAGHQIRVMDIVIWHEDLSMSPDEIVAAYPGLTLSDVHAAVAYYFDNVEEIRNDIRHNEDVADQLRTQFPSKLKEKLLHGVASHFS